MKIVALLYRIAGHICLICSISVFVIQILDWYNPYMDFMGHSMFLLYALCISSLWLSLCGIFGLRSNRKGKQRRR